MKGCEFKPKANEIICNKHTMLSIEQVIKERIIDKKALNERSELIKFFVDRLKNKDDKSFKPQFIAIKLSHIPTKDLYYVQSVFKDNLKREGLIMASKIFWWSIKYNEKQKRTN